MASIDLEVSGVVSATGWTGATQANLSSSNDARATDGDPAEVIKADIDNAPGDYDTGNHVNLHVEWRLNGTANRAKNLLMELRSSDGLTLHASYTTPSVTSQATDRTDVSGNLTLNLSVADLNSAQLWATVQEGGGMPDSAKVEIDHMKVILDYNVASTDRAAQVSWAELEVPTAPRSAQVSWAEMEVPNAPRRAQVAWAEMEVPNADRRAQISWSEFEVPTAPRTAQISWAELEVPNANRKAQVAWAELEVPDAPRRAQVSWAEFEIPDAPVGGPPTGKIVTSTRPDRHTELN